MAGHDGNFAQTVTRIQRDLDRLGVRQVDMRRAPALELQYAGGADLGAACRQDLGAASCPEKGTGPARRTSRDPIGSGGWI